MTALSILIPLGIMLALIAIGVFFWATRNDQFDDLDTPSILPLLDAEEKADRSAARDDDAPPGADG